MSQRWSNKELEDFRKIGDPYADKLVERTLVRDGKLGIDKYNRILLLANQLIDESALLLVPGSTLYREFETQVTDEDLVKFFKPIAAPDWVQADKLARASKLWSENTVTALGVLYAASLPFCYLIKNGIPALYETGKLLEPYLSQRIFETGLFLEDLMDEGGITLLEDQEFDYKKMLLEELNRCDPQGQWAFSGDSVSRHGAGGMGEAIKQKVIDAIEQRVGKKQRYLWGGGYLAAKKVRFLHASMRYMLLHPQNYTTSNDSGMPKPLTALFSERVEPWDLQKYGYPVNQEDQAYTLLTFGMVIPRGMQRWGLDLSLEDREAFLHLWKVAGYILGVNEELLTDNWDEAEALFDKIQSRQAGGSPDGTALVDALIGFMDQYLPTLPGARENCLPVKLMISQVGEKFAGELIPKEKMREANRWWRWPIYFLLGLVAKVYFFLRSGFLEAFPLWGDLTTRLVHQVAEGMIASLRGAYRRVPFFVPQDLTTWKLQPGADPDYLKDLADWRQKVLMASGLALGLLVLSVFSAAAVLPLLLLYGEGGLFAALGVSVASWAIFAKFAHKRLNKLLAARPVPKPHICKCSK